MEAIRRYVIPQPRLSRAIRFLLFVSLCLVTVYLLVVSVKWSHDQGSPRFTSKKPRQGSQASVFHSISFTTESRTNGRENYTSECVLVDPRGEWHCPDFRLHGKDFLRRSQLVMLRLLLIFDAVARKYNLRYWISRGTLLGAARHKGFIPWDIDLDIVVLKEDYFRFVHMLQEGTVKLPPDTFLQRHKPELELAAKTGTKSSVGILHYELAKPPYNPRMRDKNSCYKWCVEHPKQCDWEDGLMIELYPVTLRDNFYDDPLLKDISHRVFPLREISFEGHKFPVTTDWENQLVRLYGYNYMTVPPPSEQTLYEGVEPDPLHACSEFTLVDGKAKLKADIQH